MFMFSLALASTSSDWNSNGCQEVEIKFTKCSIWSTDRPHFGYCASNYILSVYFENVNTRNSKFLSNYINDLKCSRTIVYRSPDILVKLYKSLVRPHLEYCVSAWSPHYVKDRERLEGVQHRFTRMVPGLRDLGVWWKTEEAELADAEGEKQSLRFDWIVQDLQRIVDRSMELILSADDSERTRGHSRKLVKESFRLDVRKYFFSQGVLSRWNRLSEEVISAQSVDTFKRRLEEFGRKKDFLKD